MKRNHFCILEIVIAVLFVLSLSLLLFSHNRMKSHLDYQCSIRFPYEVVNISGNSPRDFAKDIVKAAENKAAYELGDDDSVTVYMDEVTKNKLIESRKKLMEQLSEEFESQGDKYFLKFSEDCTQIEIGYDLELSPVKAIDYVMYADLLCATAQILKNNNGDSWNILIIINDSESGREVTRGYTRDGSITYTHDDWL